MSISPVPQLRHRIPRIAEAAVERARLTVVPRGRTQAARVPFVVLVSLLLLGGVIGLLLFNTSMQQASFATTALENQAQTLSAREETLRMDLERLRDPQRLAESAQRKGMVPPPAAVCFLLPDGTIQGTCSPAVATDAIPIGEPAKGKPGVLTPPPVIEHVANQPGDTTSGNGGGAAGDGRTGHQQQHQSQQNHQQQNNHQARNR
jgi:cell division protein FtsB